MNMPKHSVDGYFLTMAVGSNANTALRSSSLTSEPKEVSFLSGLPSKKIDLSSSRSIDWESLFSSASAFEPSLKILNDGEESKQELGVKRKSIKELPSSSNYDESKLNEEIISRYSGRYVKELKDKPYEDGYFSSADQFALRLLKERGDRFLYEVLNHAWRSCFKSKSDAVLAHFLNSIKNLSSCTQKGQLEIYAVASMTHKSIRVKDAAIALFEEWADPEDISALENVDTFQIDWLEEYKQQVIESLKLKRSS